MLKGIAEWCKAEVKAPIQLAEPGCVTFISATCLSNSLPRSLREPRGKTSFAEAALPIPSGLTASTRPLEESGFLTQSLD